MLKTVARQRLHANQDSFDFDDGKVGAAEAPIVGSRARHLWGDVDDGLPGSRVGSGVSG